MAEVVGFAASIITALDLCTKSLRLLRDIQDAPKEYKRLQMVICTTKGIVDDIQETVENARSLSHNAWLKTIPSLAQDGGPLECLNETFTSLISQLDQANSATGMQKVVKKLKWPTKKDDIKAAVRFIKMQQKTLMLAFQNDSLILSQEIHHDVKCIPHESRATHEETKITRRGIEKMEINLDTLTETSKKGLQRIEGEIKLSASTTTHDIKQISALVATSSKEHKSKLEEMRASILQRVAQHKIGSIVVHISNHKERADIASENEEDEDEDEEGDEDEDDEDDEDEDGEDEDDDDDEDDGDEDDKDEDEGDNDGFDHVIEDYSDCNYEDEDYSDGYMSF